jgi:hypothetical protein
MSILRNQEFTGQYKNFVRISPTDVERLINLIRPVMFFMTGIPQNWFFPILIYEQ